MFIFKGKSSDDMEVILEEDDSLLGKASQRYIQTNVSGKNGALFEEDGYAIIDKTIKLYILNIKKLDSIMAWLNGLGILEYNNRITKARFYGEANPIRSASIKIMEMEFKRDPFWVKKDDVFVKANGFIMNEGSVYSEPIIQLKRKQQDKIDITVNDVRFNYTFNNEEYAEIDCQEKEATYEGMKRNRQIEIGYKFPRLEVGKNNVIINSGDAEVFLKRKDRWL